MTAILQNGQNRGQRVQFGHAIGLRALKAQHDDDIGCKLARLKGDFDGLLRMENTGRGLDDVALWGDGRHLNHAAPQIADQLAQTACGLERIGCGAQDFVVQCLRWAIHPCQTPVQKFGFIAIGAQPIARHGFGIGVQQARIQQLANHIGQAARCVEMVHIGNAVGVDLGHQGHCGRDIVKILQIQQNARGARHRGQVQHQVG